MSLAIYKNGHIQGILIHHNSLTYMFMTVTTKKKQLLIFLLFTAWVCMNPPNKLRFFFSFLCFSRDANIAGTYDTHSHDIE